MNIQKTDYNNNLFNCGIVPCTKTEKDFLKQPNIDGQSVWVTISEEGYKNYRDKVGASQLIIMDPEEREKWLKWDGDPIDNIHMGLQNLTREMVKKEGGVNLDTCVKGLFNAYISMYDEISKGYESGEREMWEVCGYKDGHPKFRHVTEKEELDALDSSYESLSGSLETRVKRLPDFYESIRQCQMIIERTTGQPCRSDVFGSSSFMQKEFLSQASLEPEEVKETLMKGKRKFKAKYSVSRKPSDTKQQVRDIINEMFLNPKKKNMKTGNTFNIII